MCGICFWSHIGNQLAPVNQPSHVFPQYFQLFSQFRGLAQVAESLTYEQPCAGGLEVRKVRRVSANDIPRASGSQEWPGGCSGVLVLGGSETKINTKCSLAGKSCCGQQTGKLLQGYLTATILNWKAWACCEGKCPEGMVAREKATLPQQTKPPRAPEYLRVSVQWAAYVLKEVRKPLPG